jgi:hypothetical protein
MGWFRWGPEERFKQASDAINRWWDSIEGQQSLGETLVSEVTVTMILCPSPGAMRTEYHARRGEFLSEKAAGVKWEQDGKTYIMLPYKTTKAGNVVVNQWPPLHEICHKLPISNPDGVEKKGFYA